MLGNDIVFQLRLTTQASIVPNLTNQTVCQLGLPELAARQIRKYFWKEFLLQPAHGRSLLVTRSCAQMPGEPNKFYQGVYRQAWE